MNRIHTAIRQSRSTISQQGEKSTGQPRATGTQAALSAPSSRREGKAKGNVTGKTTGRTTGLKGMLEPSTARRKAHGRKDPGEHRDMTTPTERRRSKSAHRETSASSTGRDISTRSERRSTGRSTKDDHGDNAAASERRSIKRTHGDNAARPLSPRHLDPDRAPLTESEGTRHSEGAEMLMNTDSGTPGTRQARLDASTSDAQTTHEAFDAGRILIDASQKTKPKPPKPKLAPRAQFSRIFGSIFSNMHGLTKHVSNMHGLTKHVSNMHGLDLGVNLKAIVPINRRAVRLSPQPEGRP